MTASDFSNDNCLLIVVFLVLKIC